MGKKLIAFILGLLVGGCMALQCQADVIIQDNFEYAVGRDDEDKSAFTTTGPWSAVKSRPTDAGAAGFTYTTTSISGYSGSFPGTNSSRVLASEHRAGTYSVGQSDTYLSFYGTGTPPIPREHWIQFWVYLQYYGDELSVYSNMKFLYPCADDVGTGTCGTGHHDWLTQARQNFAGLPYTDSVSSEDGHFYMYMWTQTGASWEYGGDSSNYSKLGTKNVSAAVSQFQPNTWYLVKIYHNTASATPTYKMWRRAQGESEFTLMAEYVHGQSYSEAAFTWTPYATTGYYRLNLMEMNDTTDAWVYMDDFIIATTEGDLPTYASTSKKTLFRH